MGRLLRATILVAVVGWPATAAIRAEPVGVTVVSAADHPAAAADLVAAARRALGADGDELVALEARARARRAAGAVPSARLAGFARCERLRDEGWKAYLEVRSEFAASRLAEARTAAAALADLDGGLESIADVSLRSGAVRLALGRDDEALRDLRLAALLAPDRPVTDAEFKPAVVAAYEAARVAVPEHRRVRVTSQPAGAVIAVDGVAAGTTPLEVELEVGLHVVVAGARGRQVASQLVLVDGSAIEIALAADPAAALEQPLLAGTSEATATRAIAAFAEYAEVDRVVLIGSAWRRGQAGVIAQACTTSSSRPRCGGVVEVGYGKPGDLERAVAAAIADARRAAVRFPVTLPGDGRIRDGEPAPGTRHVPRGRPSWWKSPWWWLGVSGAALAVAGVWLVSGDEALRPVVTGDPCDFAGC